MKHIVTIVHEVEADSWDLAVQQVLTDPMRQVTACRVKSPGKRLVHVVPSVLRDAAEMLKGSKP